MFKACTIICIFKWTLATAVDCTSFSDEAPFHLRRRVLFDDVESEDSRDVMFYLINVGGATISIALVAVIAGMFLGFLTLDPIDIRVKMRAAVDPAEREAAAAVIDIVGRKEKDRTLNWQHPQSLTKISLAPQIKIIVFWSRCY